jgi:hypothetical protein
LFCRPPASNILDVPDFFWDAEPTLHPLYVAIRDYLEIDPRIRVLNERCRVFLDLSEILSDSIADSKMSLITWIIIVLIVVSIVIESAEIVLRTAMMRKGRGGEAGRGGGGGVVAMSPAAENATRMAAAYRYEYGTAAGGGGGDYGGGDDDAVRRVLSELPEGVSLDDVVRWGAMLAGGGAAGAGGGQGGQGEL